MLTPSDPITDLAYVGCRTTAARNARGHGVTTWRVSSDERWEHLGVTPMTNPSYLVPHPNGHVLYAAHGDGDTISALLLGPNAPQVLTTESCGGTNPVHMLVLGDILAVANYGSGTVAFHPLGPRGELGPVRHLVDLPGMPGPLPADQGSSHPHQLVADPTRGVIHLPDKGFDVIHHMVVSSGTPRWVGSSPTAPGAGPRHLVLHPRLPLAYVVHELAASVGLYRVSENGEFRSEQTLPTVPSNAPGATASAIALTPDGRHLYVSNRGHDSIAHFTVAEQGELTPGGHTPCGACPRFMIHDPCSATLFVALEHDDTIVTFFLDPANGGLTAGASVAATGSPTCIAFPPRA